MPTDKKQMQEKSGDPKTIPMDDQGASYSSSYNESTPGEVEANRRRALHEHEDDDTADTNQVNQSKSRGSRAEE